jgi:hypothetical protein
MPHHVFFPTYKIKERLALADRITLFGIEMPSCSRCEKRALRCVVSDDSSRCSECVRSGTRCDVQGPSAEDWTRVGAEEDRLNDEEAKTTAILAEAAAKLARLQKQKKSLRLRAREMLRRGARTLDELDEIEKKDEVERERQLREDPPPNGPYLMDSVDLPALLGLGDFDPDPAFWSTIQFPPPVDPSSHGWGVSSGTPPVDPGS